MVIRQPEDVCIYELVSNKQCTYLDVDLKVRDCLTMSPEIQEDRWVVARQVLELLRWGYDKYLGVSLQSSHITIGDGSGSDKISYHFIVYDGIHAWETGLAKEPPFTSSQREFISLLRAETLRNHERWCYLTFIHKRSSVLASVIDLALQMKF